MNAKGLRDYYAVFWHENALQLWAFFGMTTPLTPAQDLVLSVSTRDVQFLVAINALYSTLRSEDATEGQIDQNIVSTAVLFAVHYSAYEANALADRLHALLPANSPIIAIRTESRVSYTQ